MSKLTDLPFVPAAALLTRVISHPEKGIFTLDLGHKGIAADPVSIRGIIVNLEEADPILHSEEHWVWRMREVSNILRHQSAARCASYLHIFALPARYTLPLLWLKRVSFAENGTLPQGIGS